jgi:hypothetical protein
MKYALNFIEMIEIERFRRVLSFGRDPKDSPALSFNL